MNGLPYYRWYPADAETDEFYSSLTDSELGFFHRCLNKAWINNGLPADLDRLSAVMGRTRREMYKMWAQVSAGWFERDGRLFNRRQEEERAHAAKKSERATDAVRTRYGRRTDEVPRARARADSGSVSDSCSLEEKSSLRKAPKGLPDPGCQDFEVRFERLYVAHPKTGFEFEAKSRYVEIITSAVMPDATADSVDKSHGIWLEFWRANPGEFVPSLARWFEDKYYLKEPMVRPLKSKSMQRSERLAQEIREEEERMKIYANNSGLRL